VLKGRCGKNPKGADVTQSGLRVADRALTGAQSSLRAGGAPAFHQEKLNNRGCSIDFTAGRVWDLLEP
jgi:hypothetical protein